MSSVQVVVLPADAVDFKTNAAVPVLAAVFLLVTFVTTLQANGVPILVSVIAQDSSFITTQTLYDSVPGTLSTLAILGAHFGPPLTCRPKQRACCASCQGNVSAV